jgi:shikimate dehydrogenase
MMRTYRLGLIGNPVAHSLSPAFQQVALDELGIDCTFELWLTQDDELPERITSLRQPGTLGANVTVPHKTGTFRLVDETSERARRAASVNTIVNRNGTLYGDNTDIYGFLYPLNEREFPFQERNAVILGAGGAARGVAVALLMAGAKSVTVANRTHERAEELRNDLDPSIEITSLGNDLSERLPQTDLLINSTAIGWDDDSMPITPEQLNMIPEKALVYDLTYRDTGIIRAASARGHETIDGLPMLVHQGVEAFRLWTGKEPPIEKMWQAAVHARAERS